MARPIKQGIDYFPLDVGFLDDIKVRRIMRSCGLQAVAILICLLGNIYKDEGYYMQWDEDISFLVADKVGASDGAVIATVEKAVQVDFFDEQIFRTYRVLTSRGIQTRFFAAVARRTSIEIVPEYMLVEATAFNNSINVNKNPVNVCSNEQSKVKESKVKESTSGEAPKEFTQIILNDGSFHTVPDEDIQRYKTIYKKINVEREIMKAAEWSKANPGKRKTAKGIQRFIIGWFNRAEANAVKAEKTARKPQFEQREYDDAFFDRFAGIDFIDEEEADGMAT